MSLKQFITRKNLILLILTLTGEAGLCYLLNMMSADGVFSFSIFSVPAFFGIAFCMQKLFASAGNCVRRRRIYAFVLSFCFSLTLVMGYQLVKFDMLSRGYKGKLFLILIAVSIAICFWWPADLWFSFLDKHRKKETILPERQLTAEQIRKVFFVSFFILIICWIPVFLAFYPAVMAHDFNRQAGEAYNGLIWFNDHHPLLHTLLIRIALMLGEQIGSLKTGMAFYSIFQMLVSGLVFAYLSAMIARLTQKSWPAYAAAVFLAVIPVNSVMVLSVTKDTLFADFFLLFLLLMLERKREHGKGMMIFLDISLVLTGILACLYRNNAIYAIAFFALFYILWSKKERVLVFFLCAVILAAGYAGRGAVRNWMHAGTGSKVEMYSVPLMQMARIGYKYEDNSLTEEERFRLFQMIPEYVFHDTYHPYIADGVKANTAVTTYLTWKEDLGSMFRTWFYFGKRFPNEYLDAFLMLTQGYWFIDDHTHAEVLGYGDDSRLGLLYTFDATPDFLKEKGLSEDTKFPLLFELYKKILNGNRYYHWPMIANLFKPSFYCWLLLINIFSLAYLKQRRKQIWNILPLAYFLTILLGPVVLFRYVYPIFVSIPLLYAWLFAKEE